MLGHKPRWPVIVLAAGRGRRMGGPKVLMQVWDRPWWITQLQRFALARVEPLWVLAPEVAATLRPQLEAQGLKQQFATGDPDAPMFESIRAGLQQLAANPPSGVFVLPIDVPAPDPAAWSALEASGPVAVPTFESVHGHPIFLSWTFVTQHVLGAAPGARLDHLIAGHVRYVPVQSPEVTVNLNTPAAVRDFEAHHRQVGTR